LYFLPQHRMIIVQPEIVGYPTILGMKLGKG
jgi:hypothetical protein